MMLKDGQNFLENAQLKIPPNDDEIELSVFGRGFGECILLCCGHKEYVVVDSFINGNTKNPVAIDYLNAIGLGVDVVKEVVITHWHQDHIAGVSSILNQANEDVKVVLNPIIKQQKLNEYLRCAIKEGNESTSEFSKVYSYIEKNSGKNILIPTQHSRIYSNESLNNAELHTLSPQDSEINSYLNCLRLNNGQNKTVLSLPDENFLSIVMLMKFNEDGILLGGDLENGADENCGWDAIVKNYEHTKTRASVFKVPHHGSETAHNEKVWENLLQDLPISILTVFNKGQKLPTENAIKKILSLSKALYIVGNKSRKNKELEAKIRKVDRSKVIQPVSTEIGLVRYRKNINCGSAKIECFGEAKQV